MLMHVQRSAVALNATSHMECARMHWLKRKKKKECNTCQRIMKCIKKAPQKPMTMQALRKQKSIKICVLPISFSNIKE